MVKIRFYSESVNCMNDSAEKSIGKYQDYIGELATYDKNDTDKIFIEDDSKYEIENLFSSGEFGQPDFEDFSFKELFDLQQKTGEEFIYENCMFISENKLYRIYGQYDILDENDEYIYKFQREITWCYFVLLGDFENLMRNFPELNLQQFNIRNYDDIEMLVTYSGYVFYIFDVGYVGIKLSKGHIDILMDHFDHEFKYDDDADGYSVSYAYEF